MSWCGGGEIRPDARGGVPGLGDPRPHLVAGQLAALAGLRALRHLDLQVVGVDQVLGGHAEPAGLATCLTARAARRVVAAARRPRRPRRCWTCRRGGSSRWPGSRAPRPRSSRSDIAPVANRLTISLTGSTSSSGTGGRSRCEARTARAASPASAASSSTFAVYCWKTSYCLRAGGVLQQEHRLRVEQVHLALAAPLVLAADLEPAVRPLGRVGRVRRRVPGRDLGVRSRPGRCRRCVPGVPVK